MSPSRHTALSLALAALLPAALLLSTACGHKRPPIPPPSKEPQKVVLTIHQRGQQAIVKFPFPTTTISGTLLPGISKIEVFQYSLEVPEFAIEMMAEEEQQRREAQRLLDELGLPLYAAPAAPTDPFGPAGEATGDAGSIDPVGAPVASTPEEKPSSEAPAAPPTTPTIDGSEQGEATGEEDASADGSEEESALTPEEELAKRVEAARALLQAPATAKSSFITATKKDFVKGSELVLTVAGDEITNSLIGDRLLLRLPLPPKPSEGPEIGHLFAAQVYATNGKPSELSERVAVLPSATPPPPQDVTVAADASGILLNWSAEQDPPAGFRIYRRDSQTRLYGDPIATLSTGTERMFVDRAAVFGARYIYGITAVETAQPLLESDLSSEHEVDYQDRFGPASPVGLVAFPEAGRVRLLWTAGREPDLAGYEIRRRGPDAEAPTVLTSDLVGTGQYVDETVASGEIWFYSVVAIDNSGNRSEVSTETEVRVP